MQDRKPLDGNAYAVMILVTALGGFQQVAIKLAAADVSLVMQAAIRSIWPGILAGLLFGGEFVFIYAGLEYANASRMIVFVYTAPPLMAFLLHFFVPGERLGKMQWAGVLLSFAGLALAFADGFLVSGSTYPGDLCGVAAALLVGAGIVLVNLRR